GWAAGFWQWFLAIPSSSSPAFNPDFCDAGQSGPVWFLVSGTSTKMCSIPAGTALFVPMFTYENDYPCPDTTFHPPAGQSLEDFLREGAQAIVSFVTAIDVRVDGVSVSNPFAYRTTSSLYTFTGDLSLQSTFDGCITGTPQQAVTDGYWVLLAPLSAGTHDVFTGVTLTFPDGRTSEQSMDYTLTVSEGKGGKSTQSTPVLPTSW